MRRSGLIAATALLLGGCGSGDPASNSIKEPNAVPDGNAAIDVPRANEAAVIPPSFHGLYAATIAACAQPDETRLSVTAGELRFHESIGAVGAVTSEGTGSIRVAADFDGEGESWRAEHRLRLSEGGAKLTVGSRGTDLVRLRCPSVATPEPSARWGSETGREGVSLWHASMGRRDLLLFCPAGENRLLVNVPGFTPVGSEERLSFGSNGEAAALVAASRGDRRRGGLSASGAVPANLAALLGGQVSASYGAQTSGPYPAPPPDLSRAFSRACSKSAAPPAPKPSDLADAAGPCQMQGKERLQVAPLRAIGTEPFWGARIEGRCVTYSHPDDQAGTRIWTRYALRPKGGGIWSGDLGGRRFELRTRPQAGCSDGMSDKRYPVAVELTVNGERRQGCAEPL